MKEKVYLQITSGRGPAECCRVVALVLERIVRQAQAKGLKVEMIERGNRSGEPDAAFGYNLSSRRS